MVVPILAPRIMEIACGSDISPALTKPIVITVVALLLCNTAVVFLQALAHHIHAVNKDCQTSDQSENNFHRLVHLWFLPISFHKLYTPYTFFLRL